MALVMITSARVMEASPPVVPLVSRMIRRCVRRVMLDFVLLGMLALPTSAPATMAQRPLVPVAKPTRPRRADSVMLGFTQRSFCALKTCAYARGALPQWAQTVTSMKGRSALSASPASSRTGTSAKRMSACARTGPPQEGRSASRTARPCATRATRGTSFRSLSVSQRTRVPAPAASQPPGWSVLLKGRRFARAAPRDSIRKGRRVLLTSVHVKGERQPRVRLVRPMAPQSADRAMLASTQMVMRVLKISAHAITAWRQLGQSAPRIKGRSALPATEGTTWMDLFVHPTCACAPTGSARRR
mmetsp:Transcript_40546/g.106466  ORF Transcript_40546/g.106466 Transcript_40546/m.106466 type:complete len:301 (+) Transcript_40546:567-1469(+)